MAPNSVASSKPLPWPVWLLCFVYVPVTAVWYLLSWTNGLFPLPKFILKILPHPFIALGLFWWGIPLMMVFIILWKKQQKTTTSEGRKRTGVEIGPTMTVMFYAYTAILGAVAWLSLLKEIMGEPDSIFQHLPDPFTTFATTYLFFPLFSATVHWDHYAPTLRQLNIRFSPATAGLLFFLCNAIVYVCIPIAGVLWWLSFQRDRLPIVIQNMTPTLDTANVMAATFSLYYLSYDRWIREKVTESEKPTIRSLEAGETANNLVKLQGDEKNNVVPTDDSAAG